MTPDQRHQDFRRRLQQMRQELRAARSGDDESVSSELLAELHYAPRLSVPPLPLDGRFSAYGPFDALDSDDIEAMGGEP